jgi:FG-GAP repeat
LSAANPGGLLKRRRLALAAAGVALVVPAGIVGTWLGTRDADTRRLAVIGVSQPGSARADFNGDGFSDLAIGMPSEDITVGSPAQTLGEAGAVQVVYGSSDGLASAGGAMVLAGELWHQERPGVLDTPKPGEGFGAAVTAGDFNGDRRSDLAVAIPWEDGDLGAVQIFFGSAGGLSGGDDQILTAADFGVAGELFGDFDVTLAWGNFDADQFGDLVVGAPHAPVGADTHAGAVHVIHGSAGGLNPARRQTWTQDQLGALAQAETNDNFGSALAAGDFDDDDLDDLAIGVRNEEPDTGSTAENTGEVNVLYGAVRTGLRATGAQAWHQGLITGDRESGDQFGNALAAGDFNADGNDDLAVGIPSEGLKRSSTVTDPHVGAVNVIYGSTNVGLTNAVGGAVVHAQFWHQDSDDGSGIEDTAEPEDRFGAALAAGDFDGDGDDDLAVGVPSESVGSISRAGAVNVIYGSGGGLRASGDELFHQDRSGIDEDAEQGEFFGRALAAWNFGNGDEDDLAVGVPYESAPVFLGGLVHAIYGDDSSGLTSSGSQLWTQDSDGVPDTMESKDTFGDPLATD